MCSQLTVIIKLHSAKKQEFLTPKLKAEYPTNRWNIQIQPRLQISPQTSPSAQYSSTCTQLHSTVCWCAAEETCVVRMQTEEEAERKIHPLENRRCSSLANESQQRVKSVSWKSAAFQILTFPTEGTKIFRKGRKDVRQSVREPKNAVWLIQMSLF